MCPHQFLTATTGSKEAMKISQRIARSIFTLTIVIASTLTAASPAAATWRQQQWYIDALQIPPAQSLSRGQGVTVAVVDSGVDSSAPALSGQLLPGTSIGVPGSPSGMTDTDKGGHGTSMAGIIAGNNSSQDGYFGIAPGARILPIATPREEGYMTAGVRWAADHGARVINISRAGTSSGPQLISAIRYAMDKDAVVVAGAGNIDANGYGVGSPANIPGVVAVSGTANNSDAWEGSSTGPRVAIAAPATNILAPVPTSTLPKGYGLSDGSSNSAAIVSGVVALIRSKYPELDAPNTINRLLQTAKDQGRPGRDKYFGFGTVHPYNALTKSVQPVRVNPLGMPPSPKPVTPTVSAKKGAGIPTPSTAAIAVGVAVVLGVGIFLLVLLTRRRRSPRD